MANTSTLAVRLMLRTDLEAVVRIETETFGSWCLRDFENTLMKKNVHAYVCVIRDFIGDKVVGFLVVERRKFEMKVLNMACTWHGGRKMLIVKGNEFAERFNLHLVWENE